MTAVADIQRELNEMKSRLAGIENSLEEVRKANGHDATDPVLERVVAMTRELFGDEVSVVETDDPEISGARYYLIEVGTTAEIDELAVLDDRWHRRLCQIPGRTPGRYRLNIVGR